MADPDILVPSKYRSSRLLQGPPPPSYVTYLYTPDQTSSFRHPQSITLLESRTTIEAGTTGLRTWQASFVLADWLVANQDVLKHKRVLELGSGAGFLGILVGQLQLEAQLGGSLVMTDVHSEVLERCARNLKLDCNGLAAHPSISLKSYDWFDSLLGSSMRSAAAERLIEGNPDLIIGTDLVYDPSIVPALCATLKLVLSASDHAEALLALTVRRAETIVEFMTTCVDHGLEFDSMSLIPASSGGFSATMPTDLHGVEEVRLLRLYNARRFGFPSSAGTSNCDQ
ncbi:hypothetical protein FRB95_014671 [Tulasnella sp. JGI-2019a]|nr:hypothetical protein FRB95_014671 [Tulasnella sp. JGI-2019a]